MSPKNFLVHLILITVLSFNPIAHGSEHEPVFDVSKQDIVFRRTTLIVRNIDTSLMLYEDALGMEVVYDNILESTDGSESRLIFLKTKDEHVGILGLWELDYGNPSSDRRELPIERKAFVPQGNIHLFNTDYEQKSSIPLLTLRIGSISRSPLWSSWFISLLISYTSNKKYEQKSFVELLV